MHKYIILISIFIVFVNSCTIKKNILPEINAKQHKEIKVLLNVNVNNCKNDHIDSYWYVGDYQSNIKGVLCKMEQGGKECKSSKEIYIISNNKLINNDSLGNYIKNEKSCTGIKFDYKTKFEGAYYRIPYINVDKTIDSLLNLSHLPFVTSEIKDSSYNKQWSCLFEKSALNSRYEYIRSEYNQIKKRNDFKDILFFPNPDNNLKKGVFLFNDFQQIVDLKKMFKKNNIKFYEPKVAPRKVYIIDLVPSIGNVNYN